MSNARIMCIAAMLLAGTAHAQGCDPEAKLLSADGSAADYFGTSVSIDGDTVVIGASGDEDNGYRSGSAYVFTREGGEWTEQAKLLPADGVTGEWFGGSVSIDGDTALIGAHQADDNGRNSGAVYLFDLGCICPADYDGNGVVDTLDFLAFHAAWSAGEPRADWNDDGTINTLDFLAYLNDWVTGC